MKKPVVTETAYAMAKGLGELRIAGRALYEARSDLDAVQVPAAARLLRAQQDIEAEVEKLFDGFKVKEG